MANIAVYCASSTPKDASLLTLAHTVGKDLALDGHSVFYGGSTKGLMGACARGVLSVGGTLHGCVPKALTPREPPGPTMQTLVCDSLADRLAAFRTADAHLLLPGGSGTAEEFFHIFNGICFKIWGLPLEEAIPPCPIGLIEHPLSRLLLHFLQLEAQEGLVNAEALSYVHIAAWPVLHRWLNTHLGTHIPATPVVA